MSVRSVELGLAFLERLMKGMSRLSVSIVLRESVRGVYLALILLRLTGLAIRMAMLKEVESETNQSHIGGPAVSDFKLESYTESFMNFTTGYQIRSDEREYFKDYKTYWRILLNGKVIEDGIYSEYAARNKVARWSKTEKNINKEYEKVLNKINNQRDKEVLDLAKWKEKQLERLELFKQGKFHKRLRDLSKYIPERFR
jgi:hypothetical protein